MFRRTENVNWDLDVNDLIDLAVIYSEVDLQDDSETILNLVLILAPNHSPALLRISEGLFLHGDVDDARQLLEQATIVYPSYLALRLSLARLCLHQQDVVVAQKQVNEADELLNRIHQELPFALVQRHILQLRRLQLGCWVRGDQVPLAEAWLKEKRSQIEFDDYIDLLTHYAALLASQDCHGQAEEILAENLKRFPDNISLLAQLAELAQLRGNFRQAIHLLKRAVRAPNLLAWEASSLWVRLSAAYLYRRDRAARNAAEKSLLLAEELNESSGCSLEVIRSVRSAAKCALAQVESNECNFDLAERLYREILADMPYHLPALQGLGQQKMQLGCLQEALELFERIKEVDPNKGMSVLINVHQFPEDEDTLIRFEKLSKHPSLEGPIRSGCFFQLALAWEKRGEYDRAFTYAEQANIASRKFLRYNSNNYRNYCARIRQRYSHKLYEHRRGFGIDTPLPVFVVGMPRSGTTLVEQILSGHSKIFGAGELSVIPKVIHGLERWERYVGSGRVYPDCIDDLTIPVSIGIAENALEELREFDPNAKHIVDKLPHNFENIGLIKFLFPQAKIISVRRDPRDIALSNYFTNYQAKHYGMGFAYDLTDIGEQLADHNLLMHHWHQLFPGEILEINYETVVDDLEGSARKLLDYIGVEWEPRVLAFNELDRPVKTASVWQVRQPIYKTSKAKWKHYENHLAPLIKGTNAKILPDPITDMITLPLPGFLTDGVDRFKKGDLDGAELSFKKMLHHNPQHAAAIYMVGLVYLNKGHLEEGIELLEKALEKCPWHREWRDNLVKAYRATGDDEKADTVESLRRRPLLRKNDRNFNDPEFEEDEAVFLTLPKGRHWTPITWTAAGRQRPSPLLRSKKILCGAVTGRLACCEYLPFQRWKHQTAKRSEFRQKF